MTKTCSKCKQELDISAFTSEKASYCRSCMKAYDEARKNKKKEYWKNYAKTTDILQRKRDYYQENKEVEFQRKSTPQAIALRKVWLEKNKEKISLQKKNYYYANREKQLEYHRKYREEHGEEVRARQRAWYAQNKEKVAQLNKETFRHLNKMFSRCIYQSLRSVKAGRHWEDLVPYTLQELKEHLEKQFDENMTWDNIGEYWEVDHIIPKNLFSFQSSNDKDFQICWSLMNLRPLNWIENRKRPKNGSDVSEELKQKILSQSF